MFNKRILLRIIPCVLAAIILVVTFKPMLEIASVVFISLNPEGTIQAFNIGVPMWFMIVLCILYVTYAFGIVLTLIGKKIGLILFTLSSVFYPSSFYFVLSSFMSMRIEGLVPLGIFVFSLVIGISVWLEKRGEKPILEPISSNWK